MEGVFVNSGPSVQPLQTGVAIFAAVFLQVSILMTLLMVKKGRATRR